MWLGACVPQECQYQEVMDSVNPRFIQEKIISFGTCGRAHYSWTPFRIVMMVITGLLVGLVLLGTWFDLVSLDQSVRSLPTHKASHLFDSFVFGLYRLVPCWSISTTVRRG